MHGMHPLCKILNTPVMSICLVKQNDGTWIEKHQRFLFNVYKRFFYFCHVFTFFNIFFLERFFLHLWRTLTRDQKNRTASVVTPRCNAGRRVSITGGWLVHNSPISRDNIIPSQRISLRWRIGYHGTYFSIGWQSV